MEESFRLHFLERNFSKKKKSIAAHKKLFIFTLKREKVLKLKRNNFFGKKLNFFLFYSHAMCCLTSSYDPLTHITFYIQCLKIANETFNIHFLLCFYSTFGFYLFMLEHATCIYYYFFYFNLLQSWKHNRPLFRWYFTLFFIFMLLIGMLIVHTWIYVKMTIMHIKCLSSRCLDTNLYRLSNILNKLLLFFLHYCHLLDFVYLSIRFRLMSDVCELLQNFCCHYSVRQQ